MARRAGGGGVPGNSMGQGFTSSSTLSLTHLLGVAPVLSRTTRRDGGASFLLTALNLMHPGACSGPLEPRYDSIPELS